MTSLNCFPPSRVKIIPSDSPGLIPHVGAGLSESTENPAVVTKGGTTVFPAGKLLSPSILTKSTPGSPLLSTSIKLDIPNKLPSSK